LERIVGILDRPFVANELSSVVSEEVRYGKAVQFILNILFENPKLESLAVKDWYNNIDFCIRHKGKNLIRDIFSVKGELIDEYLAVDGDFLILSKKQTMFAKNLDVIILVSDVTMSIYKTTNQFEAVDHELYQRDPKAYKETYKYKFENKRKNTTKSFTRVLNAANFG
jgi:hypothetical protein